jgi:hypothetical protein
VKTVACRAGATGYALRRIDCDDGVEGMAMAFSTVEAGRGFEWLKGAVGLVLSNPVVFLVNALIFAVLSAILMFIPLLGQIAFMLLMPVMLAGMIYAYREQDHGGTAQIEHLFQGFRESGKIGPLMLIGLPGIVAVVVLGILGLIIVGGAALGAAVSAGSNSGAGIAGSVGGGMMLFFLLALAIGLVVFALTFFAVPKVMFDGEEPFAAMKESLAAVLANVGALLVFLVIFFVVFVVASIVLALIPILGQLLVSLAASSIYSAGIYLAFKDVFGISMGPEASIEPPAPPAPPPAA